MHTLTIKNKLKESFSFKKKHNGSGKMRGLTMLQVIISLVVITMVTNMLFQIQMFLTNSTNTMQREQCMRQVQEQIIDEMRYELKTSLLTYYDEEVTEKMVNMGQYQVATKTAISTCLFSDGSRLHKLNIKTAIGTQGSETEVFIYAGS